jgi:hypothetical protein
MNLKIFNNFIEQRLVFCCLPNKKCPPFARHILGAFMIRTLRSCAIIDRLPTHVYITGRAGDNRGYKIWGIQTMNAHPSGTRRRQSPCIGRVRGRRNPCTCSPAATVPTTANPSTQWDLFSWNHHFIAVSARCRRQESRLVEVVPKAASELRRVLIHALKVLVHFESRYTPVSE